MGFMAMVRRRWVKGIEGREEGQEEEQGHEVIQIEHEES